MDLGLWLSLIGGLGGAAVAIYGVEILVIGWATRGDQRAFRRLADAGRYHLFTGLALAVLASAVLLNEQDRSLPAMAMIILVIVLGGLAIRYRPRKNQRR